MATSPEFNEAQLAAARKPTWYQSGAKLVTLEEAREFIERFGLVAFAPAKLSIAGPTLVEATLGEANEAPSLADIQAARDLAARLLSEGDAIPLNLLGGGGDTPDFLVSATAFRYIYTLRGDKNFKQPPSTSGTVKVSPLGLSVYETLTEKGAMTAADLASDLGREVTEAAIVRCLGELWQMLRVVPKLQVGEAPTLWELTGKRFSKAIKAGLNAGMPTALSALISLYLAQTQAASEDEIETFLSPLAPRSRVRDVVHALRAARELNEVVVAGKTLLHVAGELQEMPELARPEPSDEAGAVQDAKPWESRPPVRFSETESPEPGRIRKFEGDRGASAPVRKPAGAFARAPRADRGGFARKGRDDRERRPFARREDGAPNSEFTKPWDEGKPAGAFDRPKRPYVRREGGAEGKSFDRPKRPYTPRGEGADRPKRSFGGDRATGSFDRPKRPYVRREGSAEGKPFDRPKRAYTPRGEGEDRPRRSFGGDRAAGSFDRPKRPYVRREGGSEGKPFDRPKRPYTPRGEGGDRPKRPYVRREGGAEGKPFDRPKRPYTPRGEGEDRPKRPYVRREGGAEGKPFDRPKRPYTPRGEGSDRPKRPYTPRGEGSDRPKRPYTPRGEGPDRPKRPYTPRGEGSDRPKRPYTPRGEGSDRPKRPYTPRTEGGARPKRPYTPREGGAAGPRKAFGAGPKRTGGGGAFKRAGGAGGFKGKPGGFKSKPFGARPATGKPKRPREE